MSLSLQETGATSAIDHLDHLDQEAAALAADILPIFTSLAPVEAIWSSERLDFTEQRRSIVFGESLFFDELLAFASIDTALYPPRSTQQLSTLLTAIFAANSLDYLKQLSLVYYLLLDLDAYLEQISLDQQAAPSLTNATLAAERFADTYVVLPQFTDAMQGYWLLDNDKYEQAIPLLAVADFVPKIMRTLFLPSASEHRSDATRAKLLLRFLRTSNQTTSSPPGSEGFLKEIEMQIQALCFVSGPARAFSEIRALTCIIQDDEQQRVSVRATLIFKVLEHCFAPPRPAAIQNLLACSLDPEEEVTLESFVLSPPAAMTATWSYVAADVLIVRYISQGRYMDAVGLDRRLGPDVSQGHSTAKDAQQRTKMMEQRKRMIAGAREILPEVQKELLRIEESVEISGGAEVEAKQETAINGAANGVTGETTAINDSADRSYLVPVPLSASPAARRSNTHTRSTQAAILSAVVRASASPSAPNTPTMASVLSGTLSNTTSPNATPGRRGSPAQHPAAMLGFLAKNALSGQTRASAGSDLADEPMDEASQDVDESAVLVSKPVDAVKRSAEAASPNQPAQPQSPWRNHPTLTSSSPFSGLPKLSRAAVAGQRASVASGSRSPYQSSPRAFRPASTSPFAAGASSSIGSSPSLNGSALGPSKLRGAIGLVSQHGKKSRLAREEPSTVSDESDLEEADRETQDDAGDDTFVQAGKHAKASRASGGDVSIGRLVPGRRGWNEAQEDAALADESEMHAFTSAEPPTKRRTRKTVTAATPTGKLTRSRTGVHLNSQDDTSRARLTKSRSEVSLAREGGKRMTRSTSSANRKPLTLSNLEQHSRADVGTLDDSAPIARRTRAATAELESISGSQANEGGSTIYTISEVGDGNDVMSAKGSTKRRTRKTAAPQKEGVRRSSRLGGDAEDAASPAKRRAARGSKKGSKMPGGLE